MSICGPNIRDRDETIQDQDRDRVRWKLASRSRRGLEASRLFLLVSCVCVVSVSGWARPRPRSDHLRRPRTSLFRYYKCTSSAESTRTTTQRQPSVACPSPIEAINDNGTSAAAEGAEQVMERHGNDMLRPVTVFTGFVCTSELSSCWPCLVVRPSRPKM